MNQKLIRARVSETDRCPVDKVLCPTARDVVGAYLVYQVFEKLAGKACTDYAQALKA